MSTDTMYLDRSRMLTAPGKNRTNNVARLDKKRIQADKRCQSRQQAGTNIPKTQVLPNGAKPDFGNSGSSRRSKKKDKEQNETKEATRSLRGRYLQDGLQGQRNHTGKARSDSMSSSGSTSNSNPMSLTPPTGFASPISEAAKSPCQTAVPAMHPMSSMGFVQPGIHSIPQGQPLQAMPQVLPLPPPGVSPGVSPGIPLGLPLGAPLHAPPAGLPLHPNGFGTPAFPYGSYAVGSSHPGPYFMNPQTPLVNPMYPQMPLPTMQAPQETHMHLQSQTVEHTQIEKPRTASRATSAKKTQKSTSFAGASFATKDPMINKLPKPSFA